MCYMFMLKSSGGEVTEKMAGPEESMGSGMRAGGKEGRGQRGVIHPVDLGEV